MRDLPRARRRTNTMNRREFVVAAAALAIAPEALARRLGGTPVALVTADLESHIVALNLATGRPLRRIATLPGPRSAWGRPQSSPTRPTGPSA
jgi:hypothetical protein